MGLMHYSMFALQVKAAWYDWSLLAFVGGFEVLALVRLPGYWRGDWSQPKRAAPWWLWGQPLWEGWRRSYPVGAIGAPGLFLGYLGMLLDGTDVGTVTVSVGAVLLLVGGVLMVTVVFWNRPRWVVPPSLRDEPGAMRLWWSTRRGMP